MVRVTNTSSSFRPNFTYIYMDPPLHHSAAANTTIASPTPTLDALGSPRRNWLDDRLN